MLKYQQLKNIFSIGKRLCAPYWTSNRKWRGIALLAAVIACTLISVYIMLEITNWYNEFYTILQNYSYGKFWHSIGKFSILAAIFILVAVYQLYLQQWLQIEWRTFMTETYLEKWMQNNTYYRLQMNIKKTDNPDQRIQEDINQFVTLTLGLGIGLFRQLTIFFSFIVMLWYLSGTFQFHLHHTTVYIPGFLVWATLSYSLLGTLLTHKVGHQLIGLKFHQQHYEADFRFSLARIREHSECIAFYRGEESEKMTFKNLFHNIITNFHAIMLRQKILTGITASYSQIAIIFPTIIMAPRYFGAGMTIGWFMQTLTAFGRVQDSLSYIVNAYVDIAQWLSVIRRLDSFISHMEESTKITSHLNIKYSKNEYALENFSLFLPNGKILIDNLNFTFPPTKSILINGNSGCGKSTMLRALANLWPFASGIATLPPPEATLFLPQKPYLPLGTLYKAICYPNNEASKENVISVLKLTHLDKYIDCLEKVDDWSMILSLGEQQKLAFARILLKKPAWVFLDESTSALDEETEEYIYGILKKCLPNITIISVGHRSSLLPWHDICLHLNGNGKYNITYLSKG